MKTERVLILCILVSFLLRLPLCLMPAEVLIPKVVSDDMFYYLCIARNIARGLGATADGENVTNGFHPLWALLVAALYRVFGDGALQAALVLLTLCSVCSAWFLYKILRFSCGESPSLLAAIIWLCCPYTILVALAGVEAPLFVLLLGAGAYCYLSVRDSADAPLRRWALPGVLLGLAILARIDGAIFAALVCADLFIRSRGARGRVAVLAGTCILVTLPWFLWSYLRTGLLFQMSGRAIHHQQHVVFRTQHAASGAVRWAAAWLWEACANAYAALGAIGSFCGTGAAVILAAAAVCALVLLVARATARGIFTAWVKRASSLSFLFLYGASIFALYCAYLWYSQDWYYYSIVFVGCAALGCVLDLLDRRLAGRIADLARRGVWFACALCVVVYSLHQTAFWWGRGMRGWQIDTYRAALWVKKNLPGNSRIGSFNSGMLSYYCPQTVINLDGVVNGAAYRAIRGGDIFSYVRDQKIDYIVEAPLSLRFRVFQSPRTPPPPLTPIHAEGAYPEAVARNNPVVVYEVRQ